MIHFPTEKKTKKDFYHSILVLLLLLLLVFQFGWNEIVRSVSLLLKREKKKNLVELQMLCIAMKPIILFHYIHFCLLVKQITGVELFLVCVCLCLAAVPFHFYYFIWLNLLQHIKHTHKNVFVMIWKHRVDIFYRETQVKFIAKFCPEKSNDWFSNRFSGSLCSTHSFSFLFNASRVCMLIHLTDFL